MSSANVNATPFRADQLVIRPARESDRAALEAIAARTWEGYDYLPEVLTAWLADPEGEFYVACIGHGAESPVIGTAKLTRFGPGEWWMEGLRVDPDYYGRGVGGALTRYGVQRAQALAQENGVLRYSTDAENEPVHRMARQNGFTLAAQYRRYLSPAVALPGDPFVPVTPNAASIAALRTYLDGSPTYVHAQQSAVARRRWACKLITDARLWEWAEAGQIFSWHGCRHDSQQIDGLVLAYPRETQGEPAARELTIMYLDAMPGGLALLARDIRGLATRLACANTWHMLVVRPERLVAIEQAGWRRPADDSGRACLFSRPLPGPAITWDGESQPIEGDV